MSVNYNLLDNPVYNSLLSNHSSFAIGHNMALKYKHEVLPFMGGVPGHKDLLTTMNPFFQNGEEAFAQENTFEEVAGWKITAHVPCLQMVCSDKPEIIPDNKTTLHVLAADEAKDLYDLVNTVQPGFFREKTYLLGDYYGIKEAGKLVAVAGERMKPGNFTELSAICTLPGYTGKGYARLLINRLCCKIFEEGNIPFLHVAASNERAIRVYELLHFRKRRDLTFLKWKFS